MLDADLAALAYVAIAAPALWRFRPQLRVYGPPQPTIDDLLAHADRLTREARAALDQAGRSLDDFAVGFAQHSRRLDEVADLARQLHREALDA